MLQYCNTTKDKILKFSLPDSSVVGSSVLGGKEIAVKVTSSNSGTSSFPNPGKFKCNQ